MPVAVRTIHEADDGARGDDRDHARRGDRGRCGGEFSISRQLCRWASRDRRAVSDSGVFVA